MISVQKEKVKLLNDVLGNIKRKRNGFNEIDIALVELIVDKYKMKIKYGEV